MREYRLSAMILVLVALCVFAATPFLLAFHHHPSDLTDHYDCALCLCASAHATVAPQPLCPTPAFTPIARVRVTELPFLPALRAHTQDQRAPPEA